MSTEKLRNSDPLAACRAIERLPEWWNFLCSHSEKCGDCAEVASSLQPHEVAAEQASTGSLPPGAGCHDVGKDKADVVNRIGEFISRFVFLKDKRPHLLAALWVLGT